MAKIMLADDSKFMRKKLSDILTGNGHSIVHECGSGDDAVESYKLYHPDIVTMDINMPGMSGLDAIDQIRGFDKNAKIIIISAGSNEKTLIDGMNRGASGFIAKPFADDNVIRTVNKLFEDIKKERNEEPGSQPSTANSAEQKITGNILVIDDSNTVLQATSDILKNDGHKVMTAQSGDEGLKLASAGTPDLILLDIEMPVMDGYDVLKNLKKDDFTKNIPVIMYTSKTKKDDILLAIKLGIMDYISKNSDEKIISTKIKTCLVQARQKRDLLEKNNTSNIILDRKENTANISFRYTMKSERAATEIKKVFTGAFLKTIAGHKIIFDFRMINDIDKGETLQIKFLFSLFPEQEIAVVCGKHYDLLSAEFGSEEKNKYFFSMSDAEIYLSGK